MRYPRAAGGLRGRVVIGGRSDVRLKDIPPRKCHPERSENVREADVLAESKDPDEVDLLRGASGNSPRALYGSGRTPCNVADNTCRVGVLRLRSCFASRTSYSAQDDSLKGHS